MKNKKFLLVLPLIAILAGCKEKPYVPADLFKDAHDIPENTRTLVLQDYGGWHIDNDSPHSAMIKVSYGDVIYTERYVASTYSSGTYLAVDSTGYKYAYLDWLHFGYATYNHETGDFEGERPLKSISLEQLFNTLYDMSFIWNGKVDIGNFGNFGVGDANLNDGISRRARISTGSFASGTVRAVIDNEVSFTFGSITYKVSKFEIHYVDYLLKTTTLDYEYVTLINDVEFKMRTSYEFTLTHNFSS